MLLIFTKANIVEKSIVAIINIIKDYLSKEKGSNNIIDEFDKATDKTLDYKDIQIEFKVVQEGEKDSVKRVIKNIAEITDDEDANGDSIDDVDSTPNNNKDGEDDKSDAVVVGKVLDLIHHPAKKCAERCKEF